MRGTQLADAMKLVEIGDIRPREVINVEDDKEQVSTHPIVQASGSNEQNQASSSSQVQDQQQGASTPSQSSDRPSASNQVQILQPSNMARDHPLDHIIGVAPGFDNKTKHANMCAQDVQTHILSQIVNISKESTLLHRIFIITSHKVLLTGNIITKS